MDKENAQNMLDLYIYDYMVKNNMHTTAEIFAQEAGIPRNEVAISTPEGFMTEWWSLFWDVYSSRLQNDSQGEQTSISQDVNYGAGLGRSIPSELSPYAPTLIQDDIGHADAGREILENISLQGHSPVSSYADNAPFLDQQNQILSPSLISEADSSPDLASQASKKLIISASENPTKTLSSDGSKGKGVQTSFTRTTAKVKKNQPDFPFGPIRSVHLSNDKISCCDFSTHGNFLAAAGHEKKVFFWNLNRSTTNSIQGHSQPITDIRFKPNSYTFATSSIDKIVKIWNADVNPKKIDSLVGHADHVMSVDFHPRKTNLLCSCDCSDEIRLWDVEKSACFCYFKGANRQVRFQPQQGNLLAAATGNFINLIDVETGKIHYRFEGHEKEVLTLCWDVSGDYLVSTSEESTRMWSIVAGGKCTHVLASHRGDFSSCTFHPAYSQVVAVGSYRHIYIWNPTMGNRTWKFHGHHGRMSAMANAPETKMIASVGHDQWAKVWK